MVDSKVSRREFVRETAAIAAGVAAGLTPTYTVHAGNPERADTGAILNYNEQMEYRRGGKTGLMFSAVCLGGHWKRVNTVVPGLFEGGSWLGAPIDHPDFQKNRTEVVSRCIDRGINFIDACTSQEVTMYARALRGRREKMYLGYSWYQNEVRNANWRSFDALKKSFDNGLKEAGLDYVDVWRITMHEQSSRHTEGEVEEMMKALDWAKQSGRARFTGISSHDRPHIKWMVETYPKQMEVVVTPYSARTRMAGVEQVEAAEESQSAGYVGKMGEGEEPLWATFQKHDVAWFGIKPFASTALFKGDSSPGSPHADEDSKIARLTIRAILTNPIITAPIPGLITPEQVDNVAIAVLQRRALDAQEQAELDAATDRTFANLPHQYQWLKSWDYV
ncbi:MAG: aldo/keto reductase [Thermoguttaceae bacterium]|jgi:aryl-alcohol dehydrogenase-like predicted oxidoreductase|nr:aldo/keto reductase [Thermoguttaceae bacterium]